MLVRLRRVCTQVMRLAFPLVPESLDSVLSSGQRISALSLVKLHCWAILVSYAISATSSSFSGFFRAAYGICIFSLSFIPKCFFLSCHFFFLFSKPLLLLALLLPLACPCGCSLCFLKHKLLISFIISFVSP